MRMRSLAVCCLLALAAATASGDPPKTAPGALSPELEATIEALSVRPQHQQLARFAGDWTWTAKMWMGPPVESRGTMRAEMMFGGRYLEQHSTGEMLGKPFEGRSTLGYDPVDQRFVATSIELGSGTGLMMQTGTCDEGATRCTFSGTYWAPGSGQQNPVRSVLSWTSDDSFKSEAYATGPNGAEMKVAELVMTRQR